MIECTGRHDNQDASLAQHQGGEGRKQGLVQRQSLAEARL